MYEKLFNSSKNTYVLICICVLSLSSMLLISPIISFFFLLPSTIYFSYNTDYRNIYIIWGVFFFSWYFVFTVCMLGFDSSIWIGGEYSRLIYDYLIIKIIKSPSSGKWYTFMLDSFCFQTVMLLDLVSSKLGFPLYIPSIFKGLLALCKFIFSGRGSSPRCSPEKGYESFSSKTVKGCKTSPFKVDVLDSCAEMRANMHKARGYFDIINVDHRVSGDRYVYYAEAGIRWFQKITLCGSRNATEEEMKNREKKK